MRCKPWSRAASRWMPYGTICVSRTSGGGTTTERNFTSFSESHVICRCRANHGAWAHGMGYHGPKPRTGTARAPPGRTRPVVPREVSLSAPLESPTRWCSSVPPRIHALRSTVADTSPHSRIHRSDSVRTVSGRVCSGVSTLSLRSPALARRVPCGHAPALRAAA